MKVYISGGAKNGKSHYAQALAKDLAEKSGGPLYYIATMIPSDDEDRARIKKHVEDREGWGFITVEEPYAISVDLNAKGKGTYLLDSVTAILSNNMFTSDNTGNYSFNPNAAEQVLTNLRQFAETVENVIFVSDYIYADSINLYLGGKAAEGQNEVDYTEEYRRGLAYIDREMAGLCDMLVEITAGVPIVHKG